MRLSEKTWIRQEGQPSRARRRFDQAATPFDRLCKTKAISQERKEQLEALRDQTNPRQLRQEIYDLLDYIASLPCTLPGVTEDVRRTLMTTLSPEQETEHHLTPVAAKKGKISGKERTCPVTFDLTGSTAHRASKA
jgi:hypothetical protein